LIPAFLVGLSVAAIGTFLDGRWYGNETSLPWGVNFESPSIKYTVPIHPTQIYIMLYSAVIATIAIVIKDHKFFEPAGKLATLSIAAFSFLNFLQEFLRGDDVTMVFGVRFSQIISLLALILSLTFYFVYYNKKAEEIRTKTPKIKKRTF
jgi:prolipoprotein diacylglyceryltransferase